MWGTTTAINHTNDDECRSDGASVAHTRSANNSMCTAFATSPYFSSFSQNFEFLSSGTKAVAAVPGGFGSSLGGLSTYFGSSDPSSYGASSSVLNHSAVALFLKSTPSLNDDTNAVAVGQQSDAGQTDEVNSSGTPPQSSVSPQSPMAGCELWPALDNKPNSVVERCRPLLRPSTDDTITEASCHEANGKASSKTENIFVTHLPTHVDDNELRSLFEPYGDIVSSVVMRDIFSGASRGVGFVLFEDSLSADRAIAAMHRSSVAGKTITVQRGKNFAQGTPTTRVFIRNIPKGVTEAQVRELCAPFGQIAWLSVHSDSVKSSSKAPRRNIAFVNYTTIEEAKAAADGLHATRPFVATCDDPGGDGHGDLIVPILTKVVVENLPTKTTRKEKRAVSGGAANDELLGSSSEDKHYSVDVERFLGNGKRRSTGANKASSVAGASPAMKEDDMADSTSSVTTKRRTRGAGVGAGAGVGVLSTSLSIETLQFHPQVVVPLGGDGDIAMQAVSATRNHRRSQHSKYAQHSGQTQPNTTMNVSVGILPPPPPYFTSPSIASAASSSAPLHLRQLLETPPISRNSTATNKGVTTSGRKGSSSIHLPHSGS